MLITLDYRNRTPISDQICDAIIRLGACGAIAPGEQLPSVRAMAQELGVNPNTVQKAYRTLEQEGVIETVSGKGSFLSANGEAQRQLKRCGTEKLAEGLQAAMECGMTAEEIIQFCAAYLKTKEGMFE